MDTRSICWPCIGLESAECWPIHDQMTAGWVSVDYWLSFSLVSAEYWLICQLICVLVKCWSSKMRHRDRYSTDTRLTFDEYSTDNYSTDTQLTVGRYISSIQLSSKETLFIHLDAVLPISQLIDTFSLDPLNPGSD